jgi:hypothetical protein
MENPTSSTTQCEALGECIRENDTETSGADRMATLVEPCARKPILRETWTAKCSDALGQYLRLQLYSLELPLYNIGLNTTFVPFMVKIYSNKGDVSKPMQFIIKPTKIGGTTVYLQQVLTPFMGGYYSTMPGFLYNISTKKAVGIQRIVGNIQNLESDIRKLVKEANRFLYMYCHLDET